MTLAALPGLLLHQAYGPLTPGDPVHPGPRDNAWSALGAGTAATSAGATSPAAELALEVLEALLAPRGLHLTEDGSATSIQRRAVPSAGASYGVRAHLLEPAVEGDWRRWAYDQELGTLTLRHPETEFLVPAAWGAAASLGSPGRALLVFSVLPGRAFSRYRHRAWPLWLADAAYAAAGAEHLLGTTAVLASELQGGATALRAALAWPRSAHAEAWLRRGLAPELPLAVVPLPAARPVWLAARAERLSARRSPRHDRFLARPRRPGGAAERLSEAAQQPWIAGAERVVTWTLDVGAADPRRLMAAAWAAPLAGGRRLYAEHAEGSWSSRPVSGLVASSGTWVVHALASLRPDRPATHGGIRT